MCYEKRDIEAEDTKGSSEEVLLTGGRALQAGAACETAQGWQGREG